MHSPYKAPTPTMIHGNAAVHHNPSHTLLNNGTRYPPSVTIPGAQGGSGGTWPGAFVLPPYEEKFSVGPAVPAPSPTGRDVQGQPGLEVVGHHVGMISHNTVFPLYEGGANDGSFPPPIRPPSRYGPVTPISPSIPEYPEAREEQLAQAQRPFDPTAIISASSSVKSKKGSFFSSMRFGAKSVSMRPSLPVDLQFRFSAAGTNLFVWSKKEGQSITILYRPSLRGIWAGLKLDLQPPMATLAMETSPPSIRLVEGGTRCVACVIYEGHEPKLLWFDAAGMRLEHSLGDMRAVPSALAVSRDDARVALASGGTIQMFSAGQGELRLLATLQAHSAAYDYPEENKRIHRLSFSVDSKRLVAATQEYVNLHKRPVTIRIWDCVGRDVSLNRELDPVWLSSVSHPSTYPMYLKTHDTTFPLFSDCSSANTNHRVHLGIQRRHRLVGNLLRPRKPRRRRNGEAIPNGRGNQIIRIVTTARLRRPQPAPRRQGQAR